MQRFILFLGPAVLLSTALQVTDAGVATSSWAPKGSQAGAAFGTSVAPAGDVNGDGYPDVLVGAPLFDNGEQDEGRVYLYLGSKDGLSANPAWSWESNQHQAHAGAVVAGAGDVNADGYADVLVAAPLYDIGPHADAGVVFVFNGSASGLPAIPNAWLFNDVAGSHFGTSVATAGDIDNNFVWDVIVGAPDFTNGQANEGAVYVFSGGLPTVSTTPWLTWEGNEVNAHAGQSVSGAGDVNGDTYADVIFGLPGSSPGAVPAAGKAIVLKGTSSGLDAVTPLATINGNADSLAVGAGVSLAGDLDADGYADVVVGRPGGSAIGPRRGEVLVYRGQAGGLDPSPLFAISGPADYARIGTSVATAGDLDGDGYADWALGSPTAGVYAEMFYGGRPGTTFGAFLFGVPGTAFGAAVATGGDFDGDGMAELLVGAPAWSEPGLAQCGAVFAFLGRPGPLVPFVSQPLIGPDTGTSLGEGLAVVGNLDFSTFGGVLVGEPSCDTPGPDVGRLRYYHGKADGFTLSVNQTINAALSDGALGAIVADAGDVNRDGVTDFVVGSPLYSADGLAGRGRALLFFGGAPMVGAPWIAEGDQAHDLYGSGIGARGDINGDGYADVVVGASSWSGPSRFHCGKAWLYLGGPSGLSNAASWSKEGTLENENFGYRIALLDLDADGYSDAAITTQSFTPAGSPRVDVFYGGPGGLSPNAAVSFSPQPPVQAFGSAIANVGDWNCDGAADFVVGAPDDGANGGRLYFYPGSTARSVPTSNQIHVYSAGAGVSQLGYSIAGGYDLDGDGRSDFVAGAPASSHPESEEGRLFVFRGKPGGGDMVPDTTLELNSAGIRLGTAVAMGDLTGDGFADVVASAPGEFGGNGGIHGWFGGGEGAFLTFQQSEPNTAVRRPSPALLDSMTKVGLAMSLRSAGGRARGVAEFEIVPQLLPFTNKPNFREENIGIFDTGAPTVSFGSTTTLGSSVKSLFPNVTYHWRGRTTTRSPYFPHSRWLAPDTRAAGDYDFRTGGTTTGVPGGALALAPRLARPAPNPSALRVSLSFEVPVRVPVRLALYDIKGRHVRTLLDEPAFAGTGTSVWDGTDARGVRVAPGLYFVELRAGDRVERARLVRLD